MIHESGKDAVHTHRVHLGARGWRHAHWEHDFYPEDLPDDWRLSYYANEFSSVLVPVETWLQQTRVVQWLEDVPEGFRFYLEAPQQADQDAAFSRVCDELRDKLGGILAHQSLDLPVQAPMFIRQDETSDLALFTEETTQSRVVLLPHGYADLKSLRIRLQQLTHTDDNRVQAVFLAQASVTVHQLRELKTLMELLDL